MGFQEGARGVRAVNLESLDSAAVLRRQSHVMEPRARIEQLPVKAQQASQRCKIVNPTRMVEQQFRLGIANKFGDLPAQLGIGDADRVDLGHHHVPSDLIVDVTNACAIPFRGSRTRRVRIFADTIPSRQNLR
jgi:hypothetical protein